MKSSQAGKNTLVAEILGITKHGLWLLAKEVEYYLPFSQFPWFKKANVSDIYDVRLLHGSHLHWRKLDVDLELSSLTSPHFYPLIYK